MLKTVFLSTHIWLNRRIFVIALCILVEHFLLDVYDKYVSAQFKVTTSYHQYCSWVPDFLHNRPHSVRIKNCEKDKYCKSDIQTLDEEKGQFAVKCKSGRVCTLCFGNRSEAPSCSCEDWTIGELLLRYMGGRFRARHTWSENNVNTMFGLGMYPINLITQRGIATTSACNLRSTSSHFRTPLMMLSKLSY